MGESWTERAGGPAPAGWGGVAAELPVQIRRRMAAAEAEERRAERDQAADRERLAEERHQRALTLAVQQAEGRGEYASVMEIATGQVRGRTFEEIFRAAAEAGDREDAIAAARANRDGKLTHITFDEPRLLYPAARSSVGQRIFNRARRFGEAQRTRAAAERAAEASRNDFGIVESPRRVPSRPSAHASADEAERRADDAYRSRFGERPVSFR
jgi:hypothetical protein